MQIYNGRWKPTNNHDRCSAAPHTQGEGGDISLYLAFKYSDELHVTYSSINVVSNRLHASMDNVRALPHWSELWRIEFDLKWEQNAEQLLSLDEKRSKLDKQAKDVISFSWHKRMRAMRGPAIEFALSSFLIEPEIKCQKRKGDLLLYPHTLVSHGRDYRLAFIYN